MAITSQLSNIREGNTLLYMFVRNKKEKRERELGVRENEEDAMTITEKRRRCNDDHTLIGFKITLRH